MKKAQEALAPIFMVGVAFALIVLFVFVFLFFPGCNIFGNDNELITQGWNEWHYNDIVNSIQTFLETPIKVENQELKVNDAIKLYYDNEDVQKQIEDLGNNIFNKLYEDDHNYRFKISWDGSDLEFPLKELSHYIEHDIKVSDTQPVKLGLALNKEGIIYAHVE